jgi:hypothetical protein
MALEYDSVILQELVEDWEGDSGLYVPDQLSEHLEELFGMGDYKIASARAHGSMLQLEIQSSKWKSAFECAIDSAGKLWYDRRPARQGE